MTALSETRLRDRVFVSYRTETDETSAMLIAKLLGDRIGVERVFFAKSWTSIPGGLKWLEVIESALQRTTAVVLIIGPRWLDALQRRQGDGTTDYHAHEIRVALRNNIPIFTVLVERASLPTIEELPDEMRSLLNSQSRALYPDVFAQLIDPLLDEIIGLHRTRVSEPDPPPETEAALTPAVAPPREPAGTSEAPRTSKRAKARAKVPTEFEPEVERSRRRWPVIAAAAVGVLVAAGVAAAVVAGGGNDDGSVDSAAAVTAAPGDLDAGGGSPTEVVASPAEGSEVLFGRRSGGVTSVVQAPVGGGGGAPVELSVENPRQPSTSVSGTVAVIGEVDGRDVLAVGPPDAPLQVIEVDGTPSDPAISPDGTLVAYSTDAGGDQDVLLLDVAAGTSSTVAAGSADESDPAWSPDGAKLAVVRAGSASDSILVVDVVSGSASPVEANTGPKASPSWSSDGTALAYISGPSGSRDMWVADLAAQRAAVVASTERDESSVIWCGQGLVSSDARAGLEWRSSDGVSSTAVTDAPGDTDPACAA